MRYLTILEKQKPIAVIVTGNPKYLENEKVKSLADKFYNEIEVILKDKGYEVVRDSGKEYTEPTHTAKVWIGHSRGIDRLRFAPDDITTIPLQTNDYKKEYKSNDERGLSKEHYELSDNDIQALNELPVTNA
jgi:hypothetical protein